MTAMCTIIINKFMLVTAGYKTKKQQIFSFKNMEPTLKLKFLFPAQ